MANINELLQELRNLTKDVNPNEIISHISITREGLDSWHTQFSRIADELEQVIAAMQKNNRVTEDSIDKWLCEFQLAHGELTHIGPDELKDLVGALHDDIPLGYEASMRLGEWLLRVTLESDTLTAEQMREFLERHSMFDDATWSHGTAELVFDEDELQVMADELNAMLGGLTCTPHGEGERLSQTQKVRHLYCDCGEHLGKDERESFPFAIEWKADLPNYCPNCGAKVLESKR